MITGQKGIDLIKKWEGLRLKAYLCPAGKWTIGYGHTGDGIVKEMIITEPLADKLLRDDVQDAEDTINAQVEQRLTQNQFDALVSFVFNIGRNAFIHSTMLKFLNCKLFKEAANEFGRWNHINKEISPGLTARREDEKNLFLTEEV
jgi:lysozyme